MPIRYSRAQIKNLGSLFKNKKPSASESQFNSYFLGLLFCCEILGNSQTSWYGTFRVKNYDLEREILWNFIIQKGKQENIFFVCFSRNRTVINRFLKHRPTPAFFNRSSLVFFFRQISGKLFQ